MNDKPLRPYPKNAPGLFYVENDCCMNCQAPYHEAPDLMAHDEDGGHCFFRRQPEGPEEVERAICSCCVSCVKAVRYSGDDPEILRRFWELDHIDACDVLAAERHTGVILNKRWAHFSMKERWPSLTMKEKLAIAREAVDVKLWPALSMKEKLAIVRRAVDLKRLSPQETESQPLTESELDG